MLSDEKTIPNYYTYPIIVTRNSCSIRLQTLDKYSTIFDILLFISISFHVINIPRIK